MLTVVETLLFQKQWPWYWTEEERGEFATFIAETQRPETWFPNLAVFEKFAGVGLVPGNPVGCVSFTLRAWWKRRLCFLYAKAKTDNITGAKLKEIRRALES